MEEIENKMENQDLDIQVSVLEIDQEGKNLPFIKSTKYRQKLVTNRIERIFLYKNIGLALVGRNYRYKFQEEYKEIGLVFYSYKEERFLLVNFDSGEHELAEMHALQTAIKMINVYKKKFYKHPCIGLRISIPTDVGYVKAGYFLEGIEEPISLSKLNLTDTKSLLSAEDIEKEILYYELKIKAI